MKKKVRIILILSILIGLALLLKEFLGKEDSIETNVLQNQTSTESDGENVKEENTETSGKEIEVEVIPGNE